MLIDAPFSRTVSHAALKRVRVIVNPAAGGLRRGRLHAVVGALERAGCVVALLPTVAPGDAERFALAAAVGESDALVVAGGDGTINEVVNGLAASGSGLPLGVVPMGTANVLAHEIALSVRAHAIARALIAGRIRTVRLGLANGRRFVMMAGAGFDAAVVEGIDLGLKHRVGKLAYIWGAALQALRYPFPALDVTVDGKTRVCASVVVCNGRCYGGGFVAAPQADLASELLHVVLLERPGLLNVVRYGAGLTTGRLSRMAGVEILPGRVVRIDGPPGAPVQGDGDIIARLPVEISIAPETLALIAPGIP